MVTCHHRTEYDSKICGINNNEGNHKIVIRLWFHTDRVHRRVRVHFIAKMLQDIKNDAKWRKSVLRTRFKVKMWAVLSINENFELNFTKRGQEKVRGNEILSHIGLKNGSILPIWEVNIVFHVTIRSLNIVSIFKCVKIAKSQ